MPSPVWVRVGFSQATDLLDDTQSLWLFFKMRLALEVPRAETTRVIRGQEKSPEDVPATDDSEVSPSKVSQRTTRQGQD